MFSVTGKISTLNMVRWHFCSSIELQIFRDNDSGT